MFRLTQIFQNSLIRLEGWLYQFFNLMKNLFSWLKQLLIFLGKLLGFTDAQDFLETNEEQSLKPTEKEGLWIKEVWGRITIILRHWILNLWNVLSAVISRLINMGVLPKVINDLNALNVTILLVTPLIPSTIEANSVRKKFTLFCNPIVRAAVLEVLLADLDVRSIPCLDSCRGLLSKGRWFITKKYRTCWPMKSLPMRCGHLSKKTETVLSWGSWLRRLLDWVEFGFNEWTNPECKSWEAQWCHAWGIVPQHRGKNKLY